MGGAIPNRIPYSEIAKYFKDHFEWDVAELDLFVYLVQSLDETYCTHQVKLVNSKRPKSPPRK